MSARTFTPRNPSPFGASMNTIERYDETHTDGYMDDVPQTEVLPSVAQSPAYIALQRLVEQLRAQIFTLQLENAQLRQQRPAKPMSAKPRKPVQRFSSADEIKDGGVSYVSAEWIARHTGLHQSNVSRKLAALEVTPDKVEGNKYYYRKSKLPELKNKRKR